MIKLRKQCFRKQCLCDPDYLYQWVLDSQSSQAGELELGSILMLKNVNKHKHFLKLVYIF